MLHKITMPTNPKIGFFVPLMTVFIIFLSSFGKPLFFVVFLINFGQKKRAFGEANPALADRLGCFCPAPRNGDLIAAPPPRNGFVAPAERFVAVRNVPPLRPLCQNNAAVTLCATWPVQPHSIAPKPADSAHRR